LLLHLLLTLTEFSREKIMWERIASSTYWNSVADAIRSYNDCTLRVHTDSGLQQGNTLQITGIAAMQAAC
jgi:hypothetical protein